MFLPSTGHAEKSWSGHPHFRQPMKKGINLLISCSVLAYFRFDAETSALSQNVGPPEINFFHGR
jgi:hypothetical protein